MINPADVLDNLLDALRNIPEIVEEMDGDSSRIVAYHDQYPSLTSYENYVVRAPSPSIVGVWMETVPARVGGIVQYAHHFSLFVRARRVPSGSTPQQVGYYRILMMLANGIPSNGDGLPLENYQVHPDCLPMEPVTMTRKIDTEGVNFFEVPIEFRESHA